MSATVLKSPVGGWNARDSLDAMPEQDAIQMQNLVSDGTVCRSRKGTRLWLSPIAESGTAPTASKVNGTNPVETVWWDETIDASYGTLAAAGDTIVWDENIALPSGAQQWLRSKTGFSNARWQVLDFGSKAVWCNGVDTPQVYTKGGGVGALVDITVSDGTAVANFIGAVAFKGRAIYWEASSDSFWYCAAGAFQGTWTEFDLTGVAQSGGTITLLTTWSQDAGDGLNDFFVVVMSTGETLVYQGSDPGSDFTLVGRYQLGKPLGPRARCRLAGDEIILTRDGWVNLSVGLQNRQVGDRNYISSKIISAAQEAADAYNDQFGWQAVYHPASNLMFVNVPVREWQSTTNLGVSLQHVLNTNTGTWCEYTGINSACWHSNGDRLFFGGKDGYVYQAEIGTADILPDGSGALGARQDIKCDVQQAYSYLGSAANKKQVTAVKLITNSVDAGSISVRATPDFRSARYTRPTAQTENAGAQWGTGTWGLAYWGRTQGRVRPQWQPLSALGYAISLSVRMQSSEQILRWYSTNLLFKRAGVI